MKKILLPSLLIFLLMFSFGCGKKKQKAPDLNTDNIEQVEEDTTFTTQNEEETTKEPEQEDEPKKEPESISESNNREHIFGSYAVQLISLTNYDKILKIKKTLSKDGYETELSTIEKNGKIFYRLRLKDKFTKEFAEKMGKKIKNKYEFIKSYWIQKTK